ncbi:MAG: hypothetical protein ABW178_13080 [Pseudoxanthomonas sp.]
MLMTVGRYFDPWEAYILRARLVAEGIPASVAGDQLITAHWPMSVALGGAVLQVPMACMEHAREIVAAYHSGALERELMEADPSAADRCPACGSAALVASMPVAQRVLNVLLYLIASAPFATSASQMACRSCHHRWRYGG